MDASAHLLMCPPKHFGIEYEINPWMDRRRQADPALAARQWGALRALVEAAGARVSCLEPVPGLPDLVFTANAALVFQDVAVPSRFRHAPRRREEPYHQRWLAQQGFRLRPLRCGAFFEGAGDALFCGSTLFAGYRIRSDVAAHQEIGAMLGCPVIPLELVDPFFYHLDTCFCPLTPEAALYYAPALDDYALRALRQWIPELIPVDRPEAHCLACNAVVVGRVVITNTGCPELHRRLRRLGFEPWETPLSEFVKAGGSAKCLTLRLDGEEALADRHSRAWAPGLTASLAQAPTPTGHTV